MNTQLLKDLKGIISGVKESSSKTEELDESGSQDVIMQHIALAAQVAGVDLEDDASLKSFMAQVREVVTKDKAQLKAKLKRWTSGKARAAVRLTKHATESLILPEAAQLPDADSYEVFDSDRSRVMASRDPSEAIRALMKLKGNGKVMGLNGTTGSVAAAKIGGKFLSAAAASKYFRGDKVKRF